MVAIEKLRVRLERACAAGDCIQRPAVAGQAELALLISMALGRRPPGNLDLRGTPWLVALRLLASLGDRQEVSAAAQRLLNWRGREAHWLWQWKFRLVDRQVRFDPRKYGWGWTEGTTSWVIPTALAVIALEKAGEPGMAGNRISRGKAMLLDRRCPGGGWNAGNAVVYGVALKPHLDTTAIALMALQNRSENPMIGEGVEWLIANVRHCRSAYSLAWALLALVTLRHRNASLAEFAAQARQRLLAAVNPAPDELTTVAVTVIALNAFEGVNPFLVRAE